MIARQRAAASAACATRRGCDCIVPRELQQSRRRAHSSNQQLAFTFTSQPLIQVNGHRPLQPPHGCVLLRACLRVLQPLARYPPRRVPCQRGEEADVSAASDVLAECSSAPLLVGRTVAHLRARHNAPALASPPSHRARRLRGRTSCRHALWVSASINPHSRLVRSWARAWRERRC